jgi:hypothetical protein
MDHLADAPIANILILAGVIFLAVGLFGRVGGFIGSIFGNIEAGKNSRVLAGVLGVFLIVGGGWLHQESHKSIATAPSPIAPAPGSSPAPETRVSPPVSNVVPEPAKVTAATTSPVPKTTAGPATSKPPELAAERENLPALKSPPVRDDRLVGTWENATPRANSVKKIEISRSEQGLDAHVWYSCPSGDCEVGTFPLKILQGIPTYDYADEYRHRRTSLNLFGPRVLLVSIDISQRDYPDHRNIWVFAKSTTSDKMRNNFARYLDSASPKAWAAAPDGPWAFSRGYSTEDAKQAALRGCERYGGRECKVIFVNDDPAQ